MYEMIIILSLMIGDNKQPIVQYSNDYIFRSETGCYVSLVIDHHSIIRELIESEDISDEVLQNLYFEGYCNKL